MAAEGAPERVAIGPSDTGLTYAELLARSRRVAAWIAGTGAERVALLDRNTVAVPVLLFGSAMAGRPFVPLSYRLAPDQLARQLAALGRAVLIAAPDLLTTAASAGVTVVTRDDLLALAERAGAAAAGAVGAEAAGARQAGDDDVALWLFTAGTTGAPKVALLRHRHLVS
jgi:fatty-acyl-CoA synthase